MTMKTQVKRILRANCPNLKALRRLLALAKLREFRRYNLDTSLISDVENHRVCLDEAVRVCSDRWTNEFNRISMLAREHYTRAGKNLSDDVHNDILFCYFAYGFMPDEYMCFGLEEAPAAVRRSFASDRDRKIMVYSVNDIIEIERFLDKWKTYKAYGDCYGRSAVHISKESDYDAYEKFVKAHDFFVSKNVRLSKGDSVCLVKRGEIDNLRRFFEETLAQGESMLEELIVQSADMAALNPTSVNTVRVITFATSDGIEVTDCFLKVGRGGSFVDNGGAGGLLVGIDSETGLLLTDGRDEFANSYTKHPDTGIRFIGTQLPEWNDLINLAKMISAREEAIRYIGWDFAHTATGWVVVEGNASGQLIGPQIVTQKGSRSRILNTLSHVEQIVPVAI